MLLLFDAVAILVGCCCLWLLVVRVDKLLLWCVFALRSHPGFSVHVWRVVSVSRVFLSLVLLLCPLSNNATLTVCPVVGFPVCVLLVLQCEPNVCSNQVLVVRVCVVRRAALLHAVAPKLAQLLALNLSA